MRIMRYFTYIAPLLLVAIGARAQTVYHVNIKLEGMIDRLVNNNGDPREIFALREEYTLAMAGRKLDSLGKIVDYCNADYLSPPNVFDVHAALHFNKRTPVECLELHRSTFGDRASAMVFTAFAPMASRVSTIR